MDSKNSEQMFYAKQCHYDILQIISPYEIEV